MTASTSSSIGELSAGEFTRVDDIDARMEPTARMIAAGAEVLAELEGQVSRSLMAEKVFVAMQRRSIGHVGLVGWVDDREAGGVVLNSASGGRDRSGCSARDGAELEIFPAPHEARS